MERIIVGQTYSLNTIFSSFGAEGKRFARHLTELTEYADFFLVGDTLIEKAYEFSRPKIIDLPQSSYAYFSQDFMNLPMYMESDYLKAYKKFAPDRETTDIDLICNNDAGLIAPPIGQHDNTLSFKKNPSRLTVMFTGKPLRVDITNIVAMDGFNSYYSTLFSTTLDRLGLLIDSNLELKVPSTKSLKLGFFGNVGNAIKNYNSKLYPGATYRFFAQSLYEKKGKQIDIDWGISENQTVDFLQLSTVLILSNKKKDPKLYEKLINTVITNWVNFRPEIKAIIRGAFEVISIIDNLNQNTSSQVATISASY